jgi:hypothetical protein
MERIVWLDSWLWAGVGSGTGRRRDRLRRNISILLDIRAEDDREEFHTIVRLLKKVSIVAIEAIYQ